MDQSERLSSLIGGIYDAALDTTLWPQVLEETAHFVEGMACALNSHDAVFREWNLHAQWGGDPEYLEVYNTKYVKLVPYLTPAMAYTKAGDVFSGSALVPHEEVQQSRFYKEWAQPQGICDMIGCMLEKSATALAAITVLRHERHGLADAAACQRMSLLVPHFRRAVAIAKVLDLRTTTVDMLGDTLDGLASGVFLVDAEGGLLRANASGARMLEEAIVLRTARGRLVAVDAPANVALQDIISGAAGGDATDGAKGIAVLAESGVERWVAHVLPLTAGTRREARATHRGVAAVFVQKVALDRPPALEAIAVRYQLTPAELRVMISVVEMGSVTEAAPVLGISEATVKSHLHRVFEKTATRGQVDLVKLVTSFASPLV